MSDIREETIEELNDMIGYMIDSYKGYEEAIDEADDNFALMNEFKQRAERRSVYIREVQDYVRSAGGEPATDGTAAGAVHRGFMNFKNIFRDDEDGAVAAVENGESFLAEQIEEVVNDHDIAPSAKELLLKAHADVKRGENFAKLLEESNV